MFLDVVIMPFLDVLHMVPVITKARPISKDHEQELQGTTLPIDVCEDSDGP